jgi:hypothetical protein
MEERNKLSSEPCASDQTYGRAVAVDQIQHSQKQNTGNELKEIQQNLIAYNLCHQRHQSDKELK